MNGNTLDDADFRAVKAAALRQILHHFGVQRREESLKTDPEVRKVLGTLHVNFVHSTPRIWSSSASCADKVPSLRPYVAQILLVWCMRWKYLPQETKADPTAKLARLRQPPDDWCFLWAGHHWRGPIPFSMQPVSKLYLVWGLYHRLPRMFYTTFWLHGQHGLDCRVPFNSTLARSSWLTDIAARMKQHGVEVNMLLEAPWKNGKVERLGAVAGHSGHDLSDLDPYLKMTSPNALKCLSLPSLSWPSPWVVCKKLPGLPRSGSTQAPEPSWESDLLTPAEGGQPRA